MPATDPRARDERTLLVDARPETDFAAWHAEGAVNLPHDPLGYPTEEELQAIARKVASSGKGQVLVYAAGDFPDAEDLGKLLVSHGIRNVFFVKGGDTALRAAAGEEVSP